MRGDNPGSHTLDPSLFGSPPHARGQLGMADSFNDSKRFTPACAGTTCRAPSARRSGSVHPRMRGDNLSAAHSARTAFGSPPHARGQLGCDKTGDATKRFTPACAGTTRTRSRPRGHMTVHPRMRGDNNAHLWVWVTNSGSPPHARGQLCLLKRTFHEHRFTPACAGTTPGEARS